MTATLADRVRVVLLDLGYRGFDPMQPRDEEGKWSKVAAAVHAIGKALGRDIKLHEGFDGDDGHPKGVVLLHDNGSISIGSVGGDRSERRVELPGDSTASDLSDALDAASSDVARGQSGHASGDGWHLTWNADGAELFGDFHDSGMPLSQPELDRLTEALTDVRHRGDSSNGLTDVAPLRPGEALAGKRKFGGVDQPLGVALVDGPGGRSVRLAPIGWLDVMSGQVGRELRNYTGGEGQSSALLDRQSAAKLSETLSSLAADAEARRKAIAKAFERFDHDGDQAALDAAVRPFELPGYGGRGAVLDGYLPDQREIDTAWGTVVVRGYSEELGDWTVNVGVRPRDAVEGVDWSMDGNRPGGNFEPVTLAEENGFQLPISELGAKDVRALAKYLDGAFGDDGGARALLDVFGVRQFSEELHPRVPAGSANGGQFGSKSEQKQQPAKKPSSSATTPKKARPRGPKVVVPKGSLGYDPSTNHGTGYGVKGGDKRVHALQQALNRLGFADLHGRKLADDGRLGPLTTSALKAAQRALGVTADGIAGPALLRRLIKMKRVPRAKKTTK